MERVARFPKYGWLGLAVMAAGQLSWLLKAGWAVTWLTPIMWTGFILFVDGLNHRSGGRSWLGRERREFPFLLLVSVLVWLLFEVYNLYMINWVYAGLPASQWVTNFGYLWSFATIMPGVFVTAAWFDAHLRAPLQIQAIPAGPAWAWFGIGMALVCIPPALPQLVAAHLFGAVWLGFIFLLDPINERLGGFSIRAALKHGQLRPIVLYLLAGLVCGLLWEAWNAQAVSGGGAHWRYTFPEALRITGLYYGQMPVIGLVGFLPFALELRAFYVLLREMLGGNRLFGKVKLV